MVGVVQEAAVVSEEGADEEVEGEVEEVGEAEGAGDRRGAMMVPHMMATNWPRPINACMCCQAGRAVMSQLIMRSTGVRG